MVVDYNHDQRELTNQRTERHVRGAAMGTVMVAVGAKGVELKLELGV